MDNIRFKIQAYTIPNEQVGWHWTANIVDEWNNDMVVFKLKSSYKERLDCQKAAESTYYNNGFDNNSREILLVN